MWVCFHKILVWHILYISFNWHLLSPLFSALLVCGGACNAFTSRHIKIFIFITPVHLGVPISELTLPPENLSKWQCFCITKALLRALDLKQAKVFWPWNIIGKASKCIDNLRSVHQVTCLCTHSILQLLYSFRLDLVGSYSQSLPR